MRFRCPSCGCETSVPEADAPITCSGCHASFADEGGIVALTPVAEDRDYPGALIDLVAEVEQRHYWFAARNNVILSTMRRVTGPLPGRRVLDIGCGTGYVLAALERVGMEACGIDMHLAALQRARTRVRGLLFLNDANALPFFPDFDFVTLFDVIEHADDDLAVLRGALRVVAPEGHVVVTVPAGPDLWTAYDDVTGHKRRYDRDTLTTVLASSGFTVRYVGYFNCLPLVAQVFHRRLAGTQATGSDDVVRIVRQALDVPPWPLNVLFRLLVRLEAPVRRARWVRGGSLIAIGRKED